MKFAKSLLAGLLSIGYLGAINNARAADGVLSKSELTPNSYCHGQFPAIRPNASGTDHPIVKSANTGDVVDFYGSCDETPTDKDQVWQQKLDGERRWDRGYHD